MIGSRAILALISGAVSMFVSTAVFGATIQYKTPMGANIEGEAVNVLATFTTAANSVTVTIENFQADANSPKQVVYGLLFTLTSGQTSGTIGSTNGIERTIVSGGTFTDTGTVNVIDWALVSAAPSLNLSRLEAPGQKKHGIIGPPNSMTNEYDDAGGAITGATHNPFWANSAVFVLSVPGVTADSSVSAATFAFNTSPGDDIVAVQVPEPTTILLACCGLAGLFIQRRMERAGRKN